jgi:pSer/pThr/pTyr-binding forkhead associated (FHA) protein
VCIGVPHLTLVLDNREVRKFPLNRGVTTIGRAQENDIVINNLALSRRHAQVELRAGRFEVSDLNSQNGVFVNQERLRGPRALSKGDRVVLGTYTFVFSDEGADEERRDGRASRRAPTEPEQDAPRPAAVPLLVLKYNDVEMQRLELRRESCLIGRAKECDLQVAERRLSRKHCEIQRDDAGRWLVSDLGSQNGTYVNRRKIKGPTPLVGGDVLNFAEYSVLFLSEGSAYAGPDVDARVGRPSVDAHVEKADTVFPPAFREPMRNERTRNADDDALIRPSALDDDDDGGGASVHERGRWSEPPEPIIQSPGEVRARRKAQLPRDARASASLDETPPARAEARVPERRSAREEDRRGEDRRAERPDDDRRDGQRPRPEAGGRLDAGPRPDEAGRATPVRSDRVNVARDRGPARVVVEHDDREIAAVPAEPIARVERSQERSRREGEAPARARLSLEPRPSVEPRPSAEPRSAARDARERPSAGADPAARGRSSHAPEPARGGRSAERGADRGAERVADRTTERAAGRETAGERPRRADAVEVRGVVEVEPPVARGRKSEPRAEVRDARRLDDDEHLDVPDDESSPRDEELDDWYSARSDKSDGFEGPSDDPLGDEAPLPEDEPSELVPRSPSSVSHVLNQMMVGKRELERNLKGRREKLRAFSVEVRHGDEMIFSGPLENEVTVLGTEPDADIRLRGRYVAKRHSLLVRVRESLLLVRLGSSSAARVNGLPKLQAFLRHGDLVQIDETSLRILER